MRAIQGCGKGLIDNKIFHSLLPAALANIETMVSTTALVVILSLVLGVTAQSNATDPTVMKMSNATDDVGVIRQSVTKMDAGEKGIFVVRSTLPPCIARVPFYTTEAWIAVVPIEGRAYAS